MTKKKPGLYANIHAKQERIAHGSGEKMRKPGTEGAPTAKAFEQAEKTEKKPKAAGNDLPPIAVPIELRKSGVARLIDLGGG